MLLPKRVKYRRVHRGRMTGKAMRGNKVTYGDYGLQALEPSWIKNGTSSLLKVFAPKVIRKCTEVDPYYQQYIFRT